MEGLSPPGIKPRPDKLPALTGLRFAAAFMIVVHHCRGHFGIPPHVEDELPLHTGVSFFFVLSGFILAYVYPRLESGRAVARFITARVARIWPAHLFAFALVLLLGVRASGELRTAPITAANLAMLHAWVPAKAYFFSYNAVSWSISTEFFFYGAFPFLLAGFARNWRWKLAGGLLLAAAMAGFCAASAVPTLAQAAPLTLNRAGLLYISPLARVAEFILGLCAQLAWRRFWSKREIAPGAATALEALCLAICVGAIWLLPGKTGALSGFAEAASTYLRNAGAAPAFALLILVFASQRGWFSRFFGTPALVLLGEISFSIYLLHQILLRWIGGHEPLARRLDAEGLPAFALFWLIVLTASWLVWKFIERPGRRFLLRFSPAPSAV